MMDHPDSGTATAAEPTTYRLVGASYVVLRGAGHVLLTRRYNTGWSDGFWSLPAGHIEWNESCVQTAIREAAEEVGVRMTTADLEPLCTVHRTRRSGDPLDERMDLFFVADRWAGEPTIREPERCDRIGWFALDALPEPVVTPVDQVLDGLANGGPAPILTAGF